MMPEGQLIKKKERETGQKFLELSEEGKKKWINELFSTEKEVKTQNGS